MDFHEKLREYFINKGVSNKEISSKIGFSETMVGRYLRKNKPNYEFINALVREFPDIDLNYLFKDELENTLNEQNQNYQKSPITLIDEIEIKLHSLKVNLTQN